MTDLPRPSSFSVTPRQKNLPTMYDLPSEYIEEFVLPDQFHALEAMLLMLTFMPPNWNRDRVFSMMDLYLYYDINDPDCYKRPDWFGLVGVSSIFQGSEPLLSYVIWEQLVSPFAIVEFLSPGTEDEDFGRKKRLPGVPPTKWEVYEQFLRVPYYVVFDRYTNEMQAFCLAGDRYQPAELRNGRLLIPSIELSLGLWQGSYSNIDRLWLRWMTLDGNLILTPEEEAATAQKRATNAEERADRLAARLRELGIDPDELS